MCINAPHIPCFCNFSQYFHDRCSFYLHIHVAYIILRCLKFLVNSHGAVFGLEISKGMKTGTLCVYVSISDLGIQSVPFGILGRD